MWGSILVTSTLGVSQVTFNGGARWQDLSQPESYQYPECNRCASARDPRNCQLHLHGPSSWHDGQGAFCQTAFQSTALGFAGSVGCVKWRIQHAAD